MKNIKIIIDRFEGDYAVVELEDMSKQLIPNEAKEECVLSVTIDIDETKNRKEKIENLTDDIWEQSPIIIKQRRNYYARKAIKKTLCLIYSYNAIICRNTCS